MITWQASPVKKWAGGGQGFLISPEKTKEKTFIGYALG
jgi:hypothetical protein